MLEPNDFFENQIKQCRSQAQTAAKKSDREFWLQLAHRWEALSQGRKDAEVPKDPYSQGSRKAIFKPRRAA
jgi:hypothetical protein